MTDERRDDEILGRALARAIETIDLNETPFERSRVATQPTRRAIFGLWQLATATAAIVLALAIGTWLTRPGGPSPVAAPTASAPAPSPNATTAPASAYPQSERVWVYFARDGLPPIGGFVQGHLLDTPAARIASRITALGSASAARDVPFQATNALSLAASRGIAVRVQGDTAIVEFNIPNGWGVKGAAQSHALLQQLVYTITEEPGIRRAQIVDVGKTSTVIDQLVVDKPLAREDVFDYSFRPALGKDNGISWGGDDSQDHVAAQLQDVAAERVTLAGRTTTGTKTNLPSFSIWLERSDDTKPNGGKYALNLVFQWNGGGTTGGAANTATYGSTPLRAITSNGTNVYRFELDDARPWRAYMPDPTRLVVEFGGDPRATSDRIAVFAPKPGDSGVAHAPPQFAYDFRLTGAARVFEATVSWRVRDSAGKVVASSHFNATLGSSALWGTFDNGFSVPAGVHGNVTLEVYEASPKDGSDQGLVAIPLTVP
jgi:hypothetical protein